MSKKLENLEKLKRAKRRLAEHYKNKKPRSDYIAGFGICSEPPHLIVYLKTQLPSKLFLPKRYYGFDVIEEITGDIRAFK